MSLVRPLKLPNVTNVGGNQTATIAMPVGAQSYESVNIRLTDIDKSEITNIQVLANGKPIQTWKTVDDLEAVSRYYGYPIDAKEININFLRQHFTQSAQARLFNFGTLDLSTASVRFDIGAIASGKSPRVEASAPRYTAIDEAGKVIQAANSIGAITKVRNFISSSSVAGEFEISDIPREMFLQALHLKLTDPSGVAAAITDCKIELNGQKVWDLSHERMASYLTSKGRTPQTGFYHIDFMLDNELGSQLALQGLQDFRIILNLDKAGAVVSYPEYWSGIGGI